MLNRTTYITINRLKLAIIRYKNVQREQQLQILVRQKRGADEVNCSTYIYLAVTMLEVHKNAIGRSVVWKLPGGYKLVLLFKALPFTLGPDIVTNTKNKDMLILQRDCFITRVYQNI